VLAGVLRFHAVYRQLREVSTGSGLIYDYYYDHSHFLKDFKRYTGGTLRAYLNDRGHDYGRLYIPED
jgi:hypothetical protein